MARAACFSSTLIRAAVGVVALGIAMMPESGQAQWFQRPAPQPRQDGFFPFFSPGPAFGPPTDAPRPVIVDSSRAPAPQKQETPPRISVMVFGDSMADWLAYGLENVFQESPEVGIVRKHRTVSGLIRYQPRGEPSDWALAAKGILASEKPDLIVMMVGLHDRQTIREAGKTAPAAPARGAGNAPTQADAELPNDEGEAPPSIIAGERNAPAAGSQEFRSEKWQELYGRKIDETMAALKAKGVPVIWVGLPAIRGTRGTSDMSYLNGRYREAAEKAGIPFVDVWDGFVDEAGRFAQSGPDFEGQTRRLRAGDGVHFTKSGAMKLARLVERDIRRLLSLRPAISSEPAVETPAPQALRPSGPAVRPMAGPVVPLRASYTETTELAGGGRNAAAPPADPLVNRVLARGDVLPPPSGRADDFTWPHRDVGIPAPAITTPEPETPPPPRVAATPPVAAVAPATQPVSRDAGAPAADGTIAAPIAGAKKKAKARPRDDAQATQAAPPRRPTFSFFGEQPAPPPRPARPVGPPRPISGTFWR